MSSIYVSLNNWRYNATFTGLECWVLENARNRSGAMRHFEVSQASGKHCLAPWLMLYMSSYAANNALQPTVKPLRGLPSAELRR